MGRPKFKPVLQEQVIQEQRFEMEQAQLRRKYNLPAKKYIEIRKEHLLTSFSKMIGRIIRLTAWILLFALGFIGAVAMLYPAPRSALLYICQDMMKQLCEYFPGLKPAIHYFMIG